MELSISSLIFFDKRGDTPSCSTSLILNSLCCPNFVITNTHTFTLRFSKDLRSSLSINSDSSPLYTHYRSRVVKMVKGNHDDKIINKPNSSISNFPPNVANPTLQQVELDTLDPNSDSKKNKTPVCLLESDSVQPFRLNSNYNVDDDDEFLLQVLSDKSLERLRRERREGKR